MKSRIGNSESAGTGAHRVGMGGSRTRLPVLPTCGLELSFNVDLRSFADVLAYNLRQPLPGHNAVPFCSVLPLIVSVFEPFEQITPDQLATTLPGRKLF